MSNYIIVSNSINILDMAARRIGGEYLEIFIKYLNEIRKYPNYNFPNELVRELTQVASEVKEKYLSY